MQEKIKLVKQLHSQCSESDNIIIVHIHTYIHYYLYNYIYIYNICINYVGI